MVQGLDARCQLARRPSRMPSRRCADSLAMLSCHAFLPCCPAMLPPSLAHEPEQEAEEVDEVEVEGEGAPYGALLPAGRTLAEVP